MWEHAEGRKGGGREKVGRCGGEERRREREGREHAEEREGGGKEKVGRCGGEERSSRKSHLSRKEGKR